MKPTKYINNFKIQCVCPSTSFSFTHYDAPDSLRKWS